MDKGGDSKEDPSRLLLHSRIDEAARKAQRTFRYFWRELSWEKKRIFPALEHACVKVPFSDENDPEKIEHMWIGNMQFDGKVVSGELVNQPRHLKHISAGDQVEVSLDEIEDWMYAIDGKAFGGFTINLIRAGMTPEQRKAHDEAWGLDFGDPGCIPLYPGYKDGDGVFQRIFAQKEQDSEPEHPMSVDMTSKLSEFLEKFPGEINAADENGWTLLHSESLAGNLEPVKVLIEKGADLTLKTRNGMTALDLAESLQWKRMSGLLREAWRGSG